LLTALSGLGIMRTRSHCALDQLILRGAFLFFLSNIEQEQMNRIPQTEWQYH